MEEKGSCLYHDYIWSSTSFILLSLFFEGDLPPCRKQICSALPDHNCQGGGRKRVLRLTNLPEPAWLKLSNCEGRRRCPLGQKSLPDYPSPLFFKSKICFVLPAFIYLTWFQTWEETEGKCVYDRRNTMYKYHKLKRNTVHLNSWKKATVSEKGIKWCKRNPVK